MLEFKERLDVFALLRAGTLVEGAITNWRCDSGLLVRLTFHEFVRRAWIAAAASRFQLVQPIRTDYPAAPSLSDM